MSYSPIGSYALQTMTQLGEVAEGYYLKFYEANTTTPLSMATDAAGGTTLVKAKLNDNGMPISNPLDNSTVFIPFMNKDYRLVIYLNETDADANDTASSFVNIPSVPLLLQRSQNLSDVDNVSTARNNLGIFSGNKSLIINGDFSVWERDTSQTSSGYGSDDRYYNEHVGSTKTHSQQTFTLGQTDVPDNPKYFSRTVVSSIAGASNFVSKEQRIERVAATSGEEVTLSFYAKADAAKDIAIEFIQNFGTGGSPSSEVDEIGVATFSLTTSWQKFTTTVTLPSVSGKTLGTGGDDYLALKFWFDAGANFNDNTNTLGQQSGTFDIANVQLEFGDTATDFEYVDPATQLARCQRYFEVLKHSGSADQEVFGTGAAITSTTAQIYIKYVEKRVPPSISFSGGGDMIDGATGYTITSYSSTEDIGLSSARIIFNSTGMTAYRPLIARFSVAGAGEIPINAEL